MSATSDELLGAIRAAYALGCTVGEQGRVAAGYGHPSDMVRRHAQDHVNGAYEDAIAFYRRAADLLDESNPPPFGMQVPTEPLAWPEDDGILAYRSVDEIITAALLADHWVLMSQVSLLGSFEWRSYGTVHFGRYFITSLHEPDQDREYVVNLADHVGRVVEVNDGRGEGIRFANYTQAKRWLAHEIGAGRLRAYGPEDWAP